MRRNEQPIEKSGLILGVGLDGEDGHTRVTTGDNFFLMGGSEDTHGLMQDKVLRFTKALQARGKELGEITLEELRDIAHESGMAD